MIDTPTLSQPHVRSELQTYLLELLADDPRPVWRAERERGMASGIDQVFHFFFDDNDFGEKAVGTTLHSQAEVQLVQALKQALAAVLDAVGDAGDDKFVLHPLWPQVGQAAAAASTGSARNQNGS